jgi:hypothetical protein
MKKNSLLKNSVLLALLALVVCTSCNDDRSYADRLNEERNAVNAYLANHRVVMSVPEDTAFEVGPNAPFYRLDADGNIYMQVLNAGDRVGDRAKKGEPIYFRYSRYNLINWYVYGVLAASEDGNEKSMSASSTYFNFSDYTLPTSSQWGYGLQYPLLFLGVECEVNLIVKSQYGFTNEISYVTPFLFHVRYFHSQI